MPEPLGRQYKRHFSKANSYWHIKRAALEGLRLSSVTSEVAVGEVQEGLPILFGHGVLAEADVVAQAAAHEVIQGRHRASFESLHAQEAVDVDSGPTTRIKAEIREQCVTDPTHLRS